MMMGGGGGGASKGWGDRVGGGEQESDITELLS